MAPRSKDQATDSGTADAGGDDVSSPPAAPEPLGPLENEQPTRETGGVAPYDDGAGEGE